jgi:hypothetical protein
MAKDGLERMLDFLNDLDEKGIHYFIEKVAPDCMHAVLTVVGVRIEATFFVDHMEYSVFRGSEEVFLDEQELNKIIDENWS